MGILLPVGLIPGFVCGIAASVVAFLAQVGRGERAVSVYLGYVPVACVLLTAALNSLFFNCAPARRPMRHYAALTQ